MELNCNSSCKDHLLRNSHSRFGPSQTHTLKKQKITTKSSKLQFWPKFVPNFEERLPRIRCHLYQRLQYVGRDKGRYYWCSTPRLHEVFCDSCAGFRCFMVCFFVDIISVLFDTCINLTHRHIYKSLLESFYHRDMFVARKTIIIYIINLRGSHPKTAGSLAICRVA